MAITAKYLEKGRCVNSEPVDESKYAAFVNRTQIAARPMSAFPWPTGATKVFAVIGDPIAHSLSPVLLNAAFLALKLDAVYVALSVQREQLHGAVRGIRSLGVAGVSVTMPHKESIMVELDKLTDRARKLNSVNCVYWEDGELVGDSTDGPAFVASLEEEIGAPIRGKSVMVCGTGGAARAIVVALSEAGAGAIVVVGRRAEAVERLVGLGGLMTRAGTADEARDCEILVNATNVGMSGTEGEGKSPIPAAFIQSGHFVYDIVYHPLATPLLRDALTAGAEAANGLGMLVHQAARAFWIWTGEEAPLDIMFHVARSRAEVAR